jgi:hypothetical protein
LTKSTGNAAPHCAVFSSLLLFHVCGPNILLSTLFSSTPSLSASRNIRVQVHIHTRLHANLEIGKRKENKKEKAGEEEEKKEKEGW